MKILIIEDHDMIADTIKAIAQVCRIHDVTWAKSIAEARSALSDREYDFIFWDNSISGGFTTNGLLEENVSRYNNTVHVAISGEHSELQMEQGCTINMAKPFDTHKMISLLKGGIKSPEVLAA